MGLFKQLEHAREVIHEAPGTISAARNLAAQAEAFGAAQRVSSASPVSRSAPRSCPTRWWRSDAKERRWACSRISER
jgi:hypothetical protein